MVPRGVQPVHACVLPVRPGGLAVGLSCLAIVERTREVVPRLPLVSAVVTVLSPVVTLVGPVVTCPCVAVALSAPRRPG